MPPDDNSIATVRSTSIAETAQQRRYWVYFLLFCLATINFIDRVVISVDARPIAQEFNLTPVALGYLFSSYLWTYTLCQIPVGIIVDRWNTRGPLAIGVAFWSLATALTGAMGNFWGLLTVRLALGMGESVALPGTSKTTRQWAPVGERGFAFAVPSSGLYFGPAIGSILVAWLTSLLGWRGAFLVAGGIGFVWVAAWLVWYRTPEEATWLSADERRLILSGRAGDAPSHRQSLWTQYGALLKSLTLWGLMLTAGCCVYTQYLFLSWLPNYLQTTRHLSIMGTGLYASLPFAIAFVLSLCIGKISDRLLSADHLRAGKRRVIIATVVVCATPILLIPLVQSLWLIIGIVGISLAGVASAISQGGALLTEMLRDPNKHAKAQSLFVIGGNCFGMTAPIVTGYVIAMAGSYDLGFVIAGALLLVGATCILFTTRKPIV